VVERNGITARSRGRQTIDWELEQGSWNGGIDTSDPADLSMRIAQNAESGVSVVKAIRKERQSSDASNGITASVNPSS
jgi:hypothetical protein